MDGITLGLVIVILFIIITLQPFGESANSVIVGGLGALAAIIILQSEEPVHKRRPADEFSAVGSGTIGNAVSSIMPGKNSAGTVRTALKVILRNAKNALVSGAAGIAALGSLGAGGDTIVEVLALMLDAGMYLGELAMIFLEDPSEFAPVLREIWRINFRDGVNGVRDAMIRIYNDAGDSVKKMAAYIRGIMMNTIDWILGLFGRVLSAVIPDDAAVAGWVLSETLIGAIRLAANNVFWILNSAYNNVVPNAVHAVLQNPEQMRDTIVRVINLVREYLMSKDDDTWAAATAKTLGRQALVNVAAFGAVVVGTILLPIVFIPMGVIIALGGTIMNAALRFGIGRKQMDSILTALYTRQFEVPGLGRMTAVDALVGLIDKAIPLTFAGMFILSDYSSVVETETTEQPVELDPKIAEKLGEIAPKVQTAVVAERGKTVTDLADLPQQYVDGYNTKMEGQPSIDDILEAAKTEAPADAT